MQSLFKRSKKGMGIGDISPIALAFVVTAMIIGFGATILVNMQGDQTADSAAFNATGEGVTALSTLIGYIGTIALVVGAAIVIGILVRSFRTS